MFFLRSDHQSLSLLANDLAFYNLRRNRLIRLKHQNTYRSKKPETNLWIQIGIIQFHKILYNLKYYFWHTLTFFEV